MYKITKMRELCASNQNTMVCNQTGHCEEGGRANAKVKWKGIQEQTPINMHVATVLEQLTTGMVYRLPYCDSVRL